MAILDNAVSQTDDDSWAFQCPGVLGDPCGGPDTGGSYRSSGWPTKKVAVARGGHHLEEHKSGTLMPSIDDFRAEHGLVAHPEDGNRAVRIEDLP